MSMTARVIFSSGSDVTHWNDDSTPAQALTKAVKKAEERQGKNHDGAWLEFS